MLKIGLLLCFACVVSASDSAITWLLVDNPPSAIMKGDELVGGMLKPKLAVLSELLPRYLHKTQLVSLARLQKTLSSGKQSCSFLLKSAERENLMVFSKPAMVAYVHYAVLREDVYRRIGSPTEISVKQLLNRHLRGVVQKDRSYGSKVDNELSDYLQNALSDKTLLRDVVQPDETLLQMLILDRADFTLNYPVFIHYWKNLHPDLATQIHIIKLNNDSEFNVAHIVCSKGEWGEQAIADVNAILDRALRDERYRRADSAYLDPTISLKFEQFYDHKLLNKAK